MPKTQRRTAANLDSIADFLERRADEEVEEFISNLEYKHDPEKFGYYVEDLVKDPNTQGLLRELGLTPELFLSNTKPFYDYVEANWDEFKDTGYVDTEIINKYEEKWTEEFRDAVDHFLKEAHEVPDGVIVEILDGLNDDSVLTAAFLCGEGWSCDWFDEVQAIFEAHGIDVEDSDIGLSGYGDGGTNASMEASWPAIQEALQEAFRLYTHEDYDDIPEDEGHVSRDVERFPDPRQQQLPMSAMAKKFARRFATTRRHADDLQLAYMELKGGLKQLNSATEKGGLIQALRDVSDGATALLDQLSK